MALLKPDLQIELELTATVENRQTFPVDLEHSGIRLVVFLGFIASWVIGFVLVSALIPSEGFNLLALAVGFALAYGVTTLLERILKGRWHSGRTLETDAQGVRLVQRGTVQQEMKSGDPVQMLFWRFEIGKRTRVPKGWSMMACALEREGEYLSVYTFMSPAEVETYGDSFAKLTGKRETQNTGRESLRQSGEQRRLREAENHRWIAGAELTQEDFKAFLERIKTLYPEWTPLR